MKPPDRTTNRDVDALFRRVREVRIHEGGVSGGGLLGGRLLATLGPEEFPRLRDALRIDETTPPFHCMCFGDLAIEFRRPILRNHLVSFHHGRSIRIDGAHWDGDLVDGPALLRWLSERGHPEWLERFEASEREGIRIASEHDRFAAAAPLGLVARLANLASGPMGLPRHGHDSAFDDVLAELRRERDDRAIARSLFGWLGTSQSGFSGYPAYEDVPLALARRLAADAVLDVVSRTTDDAELLGAARFTADHEIVSFRKRFLREVPDARFEEFEARVARTPMEPGARDDALRRVAFARSTARASRERATEIASERSLPVRCVAVSDDGPLHSLVSDGNVLAAMDVYRVVRIDPESGSLIPLATYEGSPFTDLVFAGDGLFALRGNEGRLDRIDLGGGPRTTHAEGLARPLSPVSAGDRVAFVSAPFEDVDRGGFVTSVQRSSIAVVASDGTSTVVAPVEQGVSALAADADHAYVATTDLQRSGAIDRIDLRSGARNVLARVGGIGHVMARPSIAVLGKDLVFADEKELVRVPVVGGRRATIHRAARPIGAFVALDVGFVLLLGGMSDETWDVVFVDARDRETRLRAFARRPYDRAVLVAASGSAYLSLDQRLYRIDAP